jgi:hypothetical protein
MSKSEVDSDGFRIVKSKYSVKNKHTKLPNKDIDFKKEELEVDVNKSTGYIITIYEI